MQRNAIERAARARGDAIDDWWAEKRSARTMDRPELRRLLDDVRSGTIRTLFVFKLDRLTRTGVSDTFAVVSALRKAGCTLVAVADNLTVMPDREDVASEAMLFALGLAAKHERTAINDRIAAARDRLEAEGRPWGRPRRMGDELVARARALQDEGRSIRDISIALKYPKSTIGRALASQKPGASETAAVP